MQDTVPRIEYHLSDPFSDKYRGIELNGEIIHWIEDTDRFARLFGFTPDMGATWRSPDEFIRNEFLGNREHDFSACVQQQIIEYLRVHSGKFMRKYGNRCEEWLSTLARRRPREEEACAKCKIRPFCG